MSRRFSFSVVPALGRIRLLAIPLFALGTIGAAAGCIPTDESSELFAERSVPAAELEGVVFEGFEAGRRDVVVRSRRASVDPITRIATLEAVQISFSDAQRGAVSVRSDQARFDLRRDDFVLLGGVEGTTAEGERFLTDEVRYQSEKARLWTDRPVRVLRENLVLRADGMELDLESRKMKLVGRVRAEVAPR